MTIKKVFITGASGQTGIHTVRWITKHGTNLEVYGGIHKGEEQKQECLLREHPIKSMVIEATDPTGLVHQFKEVQDLFVIPPSTADKVAKACNYIDAAREADVKFILLLSVVGTDRDDYLWGRQFVQIEEHLKKKVEKHRWCILRTPFYMQNFFLYKRQIAEGYLPLPTGTGKFAPLDVCDVGVVAGSILANCASHKGNVYELTGPEALNGEQMANAFSKAMGRNIAFRNVSPHEAKEILDSQKIPKVEECGLLDFYSVVKKGEMDKTTKQFKEIMGHDPKTLEEFLHQNKSELEC